MNKLRAFLKGGQFTIFEAIVLLMCFLYFGGHVLYKILTR